VKTWSFVLMSRANVALRIARCHPERQSRDPAAEALR
jgi:hypothetical protein